MSYEDAIRQFKENVNLLSGTNNKADNLMWNLSAGLANIAEGLSYDLRELKASWQMYYRGLTRLNRSRGWRMVEKKYKKQVFCSNCMKERDV